MRNAPPPLRFLALTIGSWITVRAALLAPNWWSAPVGAVPLVSVDALPALVATAPRAVVPRPKPAEPIPPARRIATPPVAAVAPATGHPFPPLEKFAGLMPARPIFRLDAERSRPAGPPALQPAPQRARWTASAWLLARRGGSAPLAQGGMLGGSQAGARLAVGLSDSVALSGRIYAPLEDADAAEAALGIAWRPAAQLPLRLLVERRQALGPAGRSAMSLTVHGGGELGLPGDARLDIYGQAGVVGLRSRDLFADGAVRLRVPVGPVEAGVAAWGAAQPGAARLDVGPQLSLRLPAKRAHLRLTADWRFRIAGDAEPGSGPALTVAADF